MPIEVIVNEVSAATLRATGFHATKGGNGVALPTDLQVRALDVPGTSVQVVRGPSGSAALVSRAPSAAAQSFITVASETEQVPVPATGSAGGATRYIIQYVDEANNPGAYFACVDSLAGYAQTPHVVLAQIDQEPSQATIEQSDITDLREVANPRTDTTIRPRPNVMGDTGLDLTTSSVDGEWFPNAGGSQQIFIPEWATRVQIRAEWLFVRNATGDANGECWVEFGDYVRQSVYAEATQRFFWDNDETAGIHRANWIVVDDVYVPAKYRGTTQNFVMKARINDPAMSGLVRLDPSSGVVLSATFLEVADPSTS